MSALLKLLEKATAPDRELDTLVHEAAGFCAHRETKYYYIEDGNSYDSGHTCLACGKDTYGERVPQYTASLDEVFKLKDRMLVGWSDTVHRSENGIHCQVTLARSHPTNKQIIAEGATRPITSLLALFRASEPDK